MSPSDERNRGEKRTGPALNPLKGSSVRLPHCLYYCILGANSNSFVFSFLSLHCRVKMLYTCENLPRGMCSTAAPGCAPFLDHAKNRTGRRAQASKG